MKVTKEMHIAKSAILLQPENSLRRYLLSLSANVNHMIILYNCEHANRNLVMNGVNTVTLLWPNGN